MDNPVLVFQIWFWFWLFALQGGDTLIYGYEGVPVLYIPSSFFASFLGRIGGWARGLTFFFLSGWWIGIYSNDINWDTTATLVLPSTRERQRQLAPLPEEIPQSRCGLPELLLYVKSTQP
jgi:hypothetical protein